MITLLNKKESTVVAGGENVCIPQEAYNCFNALFNTQPEGDNFVIPKIELGKCFSLLTPVSPTVVAVELEQVATEKLPTTTEEVKPEL